MIIRIGCFGDRLHRFQELVRHRGRAAVDEDDTVLSDVDRDIAPGAKDDVDVRPDLNGLERRGGGGALLGEEAVRPLAPSENERSAISHGRAVLTRIDGAVMIARAYIIKASAGQRRRGVLYFARLVEEDHL